MTLAQLFMIFLSALLLSVVGTPLVRRLAISIGVVDQPNARKVHAHPVPLLGGIAIYGGVVLALTLWSGGERSFLRELAFIFLGATIVVICGALDDKWGLSASLKLAGQVLGCIAIIYGGVRVQLFAMP
ncbi:MAG TPA: undecaprenyl/decaprenyl-phosphate alpha-N-acetylglucosaminyl 1-phosphate transferase, partial [Herpetosiphonaceae bacterium]|nr:undecaprenyl/decaprenyl-phosphate alpha-N-acetylglucosaminyl 1-phosphate transferase [Herpetosiphonaceae bacterium]